MSAIQTISRAGQIALQGEQGLHRLTLLAKQSLLGGIPQAASLDVRALGEIAGGLSPDPGSVLQSIRGQLQRAGNSNELYVLTHPNYQIRFRIIKADTGNVKIGPLKFELNGVGIFRDGPANQVEKQLAQAIADLAKELDLPVCYNLSNKLSGVNPVDVLESWKP